MPRVSLSRPGLPLLPFQLPALSRSARLIVGVSGGRDSVALLHALKEAGFQRLIVAHLDHRLRGRTSAADARFVARLAVRLGFDSEQEAVDVAALSDATGQSLEAAAREARYAFLARVARRRRCSTVLLAHHADDQVETLLLNLFRGSGLAGLAGMEADTVRSIDPRDRTQPTASKPSQPPKPVPLRLLRPLLGVRRETITAWLHARRIPFREDATNAETGPGGATRNRIRHELLPLAEAIFGRNLRPALLRTAAIVQAEEAFLDSQTAPVPQGELTVAAMRALPLALQRRTVRAWLQGAGVPQVGFEAVETVRSLLNGERAKVNLPGDWHARRRAKRLFLEPPAEGPSGV
jgi:tRNA(Ile)-lysidine synthase